MLQRNQTDVAGPVQKKKPRPIGVGASLLNRGSDNIPTAFSYREAAYRHLKASGNP